MIGPMIYRANKIRIKRHEYSESRRKLPLDPKPYYCKYSEKTRVPVGEIAWCCTFAPRPGYEQDRSKYEH